MHHPSAETDLQIAEDHVETYRGFVSGSVAVILYCGFIMVALVSLGFAHSRPVFWALSGLILGAVSVLIDLRTGAKWRLTGTLLLLYGLFTGYNITS